ncbi:MAG: helix-turn-helix transcriptional regulator [Thermomicrobiales bacterium]
MYLLSCRCPCRRRCVIAALTDPRLTPFPAAPLLVGRDRELGLLRDQIALALTGQGHLALIGGEAGIGKTALADAICREAAEQDALVLVGRCYDLTETPPYGPWVELFGTYAPAHDRPALPAAFAQRGTIGDVNSQAALFHDVQDFLTALAAHGPLLLVLDDLHWADPASLDLLRFLARALAPLPILMLVTYRADELTRRHPLYALLPVLERESGATRLDLRRLSPEAVGTLVAARYPTSAADADRLVGYLHTRAAGNAFFTIQLLRALAEGDVLRPADGGWTVGDLSGLRVPLALRQVIDGRLARLGDAAQELLGVAAVIGQEAPLALWAAVAERDEEALLTLVERAAHVLVETPDGMAVRFEHALVREAVYEGLSPARRRLLHRQIGERLATRANPDPDSVAMHFQRAGWAGDGRAVAWLVRAGERAQLAYAQHTAIERYEAALALLDASDGDLAERGWLRYRIGRLYRSTAPRQGIEYLDEALRIAIVVGDRALAAAARYTHGLCVFNAGDRVAGLPEMIAGADALEALPLEEQERLDLGPDAEGVPTITSPRGMVVGALATSGRIAEAIAMGEAMREGGPRHTPLGELGWATYGDRFSALTFAYAVAGRPDAARDAFTRGHEHKRAVGDFGTLAVSMTSYLMGVSLNYFTEQLDAHWRLAAEAAAAWERANLTGARTVYPVRSLVLMLTGQWSEARVEAESALPSLLPSLLPAAWVRWYYYIPVVLGTIASAQGDPETAWAFIGLMLPSGAQTAHGGPGWPLLRLGAALHLAAGDVLAAKEWIEAHDRWLAWGQMVLFQSEGQALWARYHRQAGDTDKADAHARQALAHATEPRQPLALLAAHRLLGELDTERGRFDQAADHLNQSLTLADACHAPYERALTLLARAELRAATGDDREAVRLLNSARALCIPLGAKPALARADALAARLRPTYPAGLSAREVEVLRLLTRGMSNSAIAAQLFVSVRTIERHIGNLYTKIGAHNRADATAYAFRHDLT